MRAWVQKGLSALLAVMLTLTTLMVSGPKEQAYAAELSDPDTFIKGVDISTLQAIEAKGIKYYDQVNGQRQEKELLAILKERGVNYVRLRVWNNPMHSDGFNDAAHLITMAQRVKAAGMKLLVDFHYSDFWADPGQQVKPEAWKNLMFPELKQAVYDYTAEVMNGLKAVNAYPDMVQIGNEINNGMMLPDGSASQFAKLAELLKEGVRAVRETTPDGQTTKIMIHLAEGGDNHKFRSFFDQVEAQEVDYDVIGMSYYPYWHGTFQQLKTNMDDMAARYGKQIVVAETAYPHTLEDVDGPGNIAGADQVRIAGFEATPENQQLVTELVMNTVAHVEDNKGLGIFYWEPAWLAGVGWKTGEGNGWENQAMFDFDGNALSSLNAFKFTPDTNAAKLPVMVYASPAITIAKGVTPSLPDTAGVLYNEGSISNTAVTWDAIAEDKLNEPGKFTLEGTVTGLNQKASIEITVLANPNLVQNEGFESGSLTHWSLTGTENSGKIEQNAGNAHSGTYAFNYWNGSNYAYQLTQTVTGLENGTYTLKAWSSGGGGETKLKLFGETAGGTTLSTDVVNIGYNVWKQYTVPNIVVTNGQAKIGFDIEAPAGTWGYFDDIELVMVNKTEPTQGGTGNSDNVPKPGMVTISPGQMKKNEDGSTTVKLPAAVTEVVIPSGLYDQLNKQPVKFEADNLSLEIPAELFHELQSKLTDMANSAITLKLQPVGKTDTEQLLAQSGQQAEHTQIELVGEAYEFKLSIKNGAGDEEVLSQFSKPITIRLKAESASNADKASVYYIDEDGSLEYVAGKLIDGEWIAQIEHFSMYAVLKVTKQFADVPAGYWAHDVINELAAKQIVKGTTASTFEPGRTISRAEFASLLVRVLKLTGDAEHHFADVAADAWYAGAVSAAFEAGIINGRSKSVFDPDASITRQEMAVMLMKAYSVKKVTSAALENTRPFDDADRIDEWAMSSIKSALEIGLLKGRNDNRFVPKAPMTRAEAAQAIYRLIAV